ncbi:MAG: TIGR02757 family protein [Bacteroidetes bacterium]|nr:TIGR02757 family protein [Bacteroidota bacterium]
MNKQNLLKLKRKLDYHYRAFDRTTISPDPLQFLHNYNDFYNIELAGIIASTFAYGNVTQIINSLQKVFGILGNNPLEFVLNYKYESDRKYFTGIKHRFYTEDDISKLFYGLNKVYTVYGSLNYLFVLYYFDNEENIKDSVSRFCNNLTDLCSIEKIVSPGLKFMFPDPYKGSACKRMNLFLRWMVRRDELDFGLWKEIPKNRLLIPVDTHIARICKELKLTKQKNVSWKMAEEITGNLKKIEPVDPVKYDFAICHLGIRKMDF